MKKYFFFFTLLSFFNLNNFAQPFFQRYDGYQVKINGNDISLPWAGGLNCPQVSNIDLNLDGINDLFIFDRIGDKVKTFLNKGITNALEYEYAPEYEKKFPSFDSWVLLADYNCDGKADIFSYDGGGGIRVYKNASTTMNGLQFTLAVNYIKSIYYPQYGNVANNIAVNQIEIPAISDIDGDGDLDVISSSSAYQGRYIEYNINKSIELYGTCDSLKFERKNGCWGYVTDLGNNTFVLSDTCDPQWNVPNPEMIKNTTTNANRSSSKDGAACRLCIDIDGDGDKDLIQGHLTYKNLNLFTNAGSPTAGHFSALDFNFPSNNGGAAPVDLTIYPCAYYVDVNTDGKNDLIVSPTARNVSENFTSLIYYKNIGTNSFPVFQYQQSDLLQDNMIEVGEGAYPALFDYDNDGLKDLFIGNYGYYGYPNYSSKIAQFKNIGTSTVPKFELVTRDYASLSSLNILNIIPSFGDLDGDGDSDMIIGGNNGRLHYFENNAPIGFTANFVLTQVNFRNSNNRIIDVGDCAAPYIYDMDGDGKNDLVIGSRNGKLAYYHRINNTGAPQMDSVSHFLGGINVTPFQYIEGYSFPYIYKNGGKTELLVGSRFGYLYRYDHIDGNLTDMFHLIDSTFQNIAEGSNSSPAGDDINNDGYLDLFIGNYLGGISFYKGVSSLVAVEKINHVIAWNVDLYPNPANNFITIQITNTNSKIFKVELYNTLGQLILSKQISDKLVTVNTEELNQGVYICKVSEINPLHSETIVKRLIIKH